MFLPSSINIYAVIKTGLMLSFTLDLNQFYILNKLNSGSDIKGDLLNVLSSCPS